MLEKRRTHRSFLSDEEASRDTRRTEEAVRSIVGNRQVRSSDVRIKQAPSCFVVAPTVRVGETDCFIVEFNGKDRQVAVYGKEIPSEAPFKLKLKISETKDMICLLEKAKAVMEKEEVTRIGEGKNFIVDYDGNQKLVMVYGKETSECKFKLAFDESETTAIINLLVKARTLF